MHHSPPLPPPPQSSHFLPHFLHLFHLFSSSFWPGPPSCRGVTVQCICPNWEMYLSYLQSVFVQFPAWKGSAHISPPSCRGHCWGGRLLYSSGIVAWHKSSPNATHGKQGCLETVLTISHWAKWKSLHTIGRWSSASSPWPVQDATVARWFWDRKKLSLKILFEIILKVKKSALKMTSRSVKKVLSLQRTQSLATCSLLSFHGTAPV